MKTIYDKLLEKNALDILKIWDYELNGNPRNLLYSSKMEIHLICEKCGERYVSRIDHVISGTRCKKCSIKERERKKLLQNVKKGNTLQVLFPNIASEWDYEKNKPITPDIVPPKSNKVYYWHCQKCGKSWTSTPNYRTKTLSNCPFCSGYYATESNCLANLFPNIASEWDYENNGELTPKNVKPNSNKIVWWKCKKGHTWKQKIINRTLYNSPCPVCSGKNTQEALLDDSRKSKILTFKNYQTINRNDLLEYWSSKNSIKLIDVSVNDTKSFYWNYNGFLVFCSIGAMIDILDKGQTHKLAVGFNDFATIHPELLLEWDYDKNEKEPSEYTGGSNAFVWWKCERGHSWKARIAQRVLGTGCPQCKKELHTSFPEQAILFYLSKVCDVESRYLIDGKEADIFIKSKRVAIEYNGYFFHGKTKKATYDEEKVKFFSDKGILLIKVIDTREPIKTYVENNDIHCHMDQKYYVLKEVINRICLMIKIDCPPIDIDKDYQLIMKQYFQLAKKGSLAERNPKLAAEWHPTKNGSLKPDQFLVSSSKYVWWLGSCGHEWQAKISNRNRGKGCPICNQYVVTSDNNLAALYPNIAAEWHPTKNGKLKPDDVLPGSNKKVWWLDEEGNEWESTINTRVRYKSGAPQKRGIRSIETRLQKRLEREGSVFDNYPKLFDYWDSDKNKNIDYKKLLKGSHVVVWWKCPKCGFSFQKEIRHEVEKYINGAPCPKCIKQ